MTSLFMSITSKVDGTIQQAYNNDPLRQFTALCCVMLLE